MEGIFNREEFAIHLPIYGRWPYWKLFAESKEKPRFIVRLGVDICRLWVGDETYVLFIKRTSTDRFALHLQPGSRELVVTHRQEFKFELEISHRGHTYEVLSQDGQRFMRRSDGHIVALFETAWRDSDIARNILHWVHYTAEESAMLVAVFFCIAARFDPLSNKHDE